MLRQKQGPIILFDLYAIEIDVINLYEINFLHFVNLTILFASIHN